MPSITVVSQRLFTFERYTLSASHGHLPIPVQHKGKSNWESSTQMYRDTNQLQERPNEFLRQHMDVYVA